MLVVLPYPTELVFMVAVSENFHINHNQNLEEKYYTRKGLESFLDSEDFPRLSTDGENVFAKAVKNKLSKNFINNNGVKFSYYILTTPDKKPFDPSIKHSIEPKISKSFINKVCKSELIFTEVNYAIFHKYILFLKGESKKLLQEISRDIK